MVILEISICLCVYFGECVVYNIVFVLKDKFIFFIYFVNKFLIKILMF